MQFKLAALTAVLAAATLTAAAPTTDSQASSPGLTAIAGALLGALQPLANGVSAGAVQAAGDIEAGVSNVGVGLNQATNGAGGVAADTAAGAGQTLAQAPPAVVQTVHNIDVSPGLVGNLDHTLLGDRRGLVVAQSA